MTYAQLMLHLRNVLDAFDGHNGDVNLRSCFPLLVIAVVPQPSLYPDIHPRDDEIVVDLYETVTYDKLNELCTSPMVVSSLDPGAYWYADRRSVTIFDIHFTVRPGEYLPCVNRIVSLIVREGAGIIMPSDGRESHQRQYSAGALSLVMMSPHSNASVTSTLELILECLSCTWWNDCARGSTDSYFKLDLVVI
jgi:hypothetical protein